MRRKPHLTRNQHNVLLVANDHELGEVEFGPPSPVSFAMSVEGERPIVFAYGVPQYFLSRRGYLEKTEEDRVYRITEAGRQALQHGRVAQ
jgi:hypothetical protein